MVLAVGPASPAAVADFGPPERVSAPDDARNYQLSRLANDLMVVDGDGAVHAFYWRGAEGASGASPENPSWVLHNVRRPDGSWAGEVAIDDSEVGGERIGGRHPSPALARDGSIWVAWHDYRHCTEGKNWMDNAEIYADRMPPGGDFSDEDVRLSLSTASHFGANGYSPRLEAEPTSTGLAVAWYDLEWNVAEIMLKRTGEDGLFDSTETMDAMRLTNVADRGGDWLASLWMPDMALDATGQAHLIWVKGMYGDAMDLFYARVGLDGQVAETITIASKAVNGFYYPAHLEIDPASGDLWVAYAEMNGAQDVILRRRDASTGTFDAAVRLDRPGWQMSPDAEPGPDGLLHVVWTDRRADTDRDVLYASYDPTAGEWSDVVTLTTEPARWERPTVTVDGDGNAYVLFEENRGETVSGTVWFRTTCTSVSAPLGASAGLWALYR